METPATELRETVRDVLLSSEAFQSLDKDKRLDLAQSLIKVCQTALALAAEEQHPAVPRMKRPVAMAQAAGSQFSGVAADKVASTTRNILNAVSFPRFVTELINGVFKALIDSNQTQMQSYVELIKNVAASTEGFSDVNLAPD